MPSHSSGKTCSNKVTTSKEYIKGLANTDASLLNGRVTACDRPAGLQAAVRDHSWYNESLYDDIMAEF